MRNPHNPEIIVVDPRRTETAMAATLHLPVRPKSDLTLLYGLAHLLDRARLRSTGPSSTPTRRASTSSRRSSAGSTRSSWRARPAWTPKRSSTPPGGSRGASGSRSGGRWGSTRAIRASRRPRRSINLALMTGNIGRPGTGANSITGQCNAMGSRLFSNTTNLLGGHDFTDPAHRAEVAALLDIPEERIPDRAELGVRRIIEGIRGGQDPRPVGRRHQPGPFLDRPGRAARDPRPARLPGRAGHVPLDRDRRARRPAAAGGGLGREGRDVHQLGAAGRADQEGLPRSRAGAFRLSHFQARGCIITAVARCSPNGSLPRRSFRSSSGSRRAGLATSPASPTTACSTSRAACSGPTRSENPDPTPQRRLFADGRFYHPDGRARFLFEEPRPLPEPTGRRVSVSTPHRPRQRGAVAHADADGQVGRPPQALPARPLRRDQPRRRRGSRPEHRPMGGRRVAARVGPRPGVRHPDRARRATLPSHARRLDQPSDPLCRSTPSRDSRLTRPARRGFARPLMVKSPTITTPCPLTDRLDIGPDE